MIPGFTIHELIHEGSLTLVYRAENNDSGERVILKTLKPDFLVPSAKARLRHEFTITRALQFDEIVPARSLEQHEEEIALVLEDFDGISLYQLLQSEALELSEVLDLAIQIVAAIEKLHQYKVIHKDIKPQNLIINRHNGTVKLTDFGISTQLPQENQAVVNPRVLEGTLSYMSPEQTARMNRGIDYRTDFYSFGVTLYEMLTGGLPFQTDDPMELIHCHIAKHPDPPQLRQPELPQVLSDIVMKLMAKMPEDRYQSAYGLKWDLTFCLEQWHKQGAIEDFRLGTKDVISRFLIPQTLYGRDREIASLMATFQQACQGQAKTMLVSGAPGIGKSAIINEIHKPIVAQRGYFISGKFDQFQGNVPYIALIRAFRELIRQILTESEQQIAVWKGRLLSALGQNGQIVIDIIPELELIIGKQRLLSILPAAESQNRFNLVFLNFIHVFAQQEHPLVIFLDDLQWADSGSLAMMKLFMTDQKARYLFIIGTYRDNEVQPGSLLLVTLDEIARLGVTIERITIQPLQVEHILDLLCDTFFCTHSEAKTLGELVFEKTGGNPFFVNEFIKSLHKKELVSFSSKQEKWQWNVESIRSMETSANVVELMVSKIKDLEARAQNCLKLAACIGNQFELRTLSLVYEKTPLDTAADLWPAIQEGLIQPIGSAYKLVHNQAAADYYSEILSLAAGLDNIGYRFLHDRIQQAAYSLIIQEEREVTHYRIGRLLLQEASPRRLEEGLFDIVNQLNFGLALVNALEEKVELARLNLKAGKKAKASSAYDVALGYLELANRLLDNDNWKHEFQLMFEIKRDLAECRYLTGHFEEAEKLFRILLFKAKSRWDQAEIYRIRLKLYTAIGKFDDSIRAGIDGLKLFGIRASLIPNPFTIVWLILLTGFKLYRRKIADLGNLPKITDPKSIWILRFLENLVMPSYLSGRDLVLLTMGLKALNHSLKVGHTEFSPVVYSLYGSFLSAIFGRYRKGYEFGQLAIGLSEQYQNPEFRAVVLFHAQCIINHWRVHLKECIPIAKKSYQDCLDSGNLIWACFNGIRIPAARFIIGDPIAEVVKEAETYLGFIKLTKDKNMIDNAMFLYHAYQCFLGLTKNEACWDTADFSESESLLRMLDSDFKSGTTIFFFYKAQNRYLFGDYQTALDYARLALKTNNAILGLPEFAELYFYYALILAALYPEFSKLQKPLVRARLVLLKNRFKKLAENCPGNHLHRYLLIKAEISRLTGDYKKAIGYYDQALKAARKSGYIQHQAIIAELTAKLYRAMGIKEIAKLYIVKAKHLYQRWGARTKIENLDHTFPDIAKSSLSPESMLEPISSHFSTVAAGQVDRLDLVSVAKASQAISKEIVFDDLLKTLLKIVIENAGGQRGLLILKEGDAFNIMSEMAIDAKQVVTDPLPFQASEELAQSVVNYVIRTSNNIVLNDATTDRRFADDTYIVRRKPKSLLCIPIHHQGSLTGILYMENNQTTHAFTPNRIELLHLLASQAAISIRNAGLYKQLDEYSHTLEQKVKQRTEELNQKNIKLEIAIEKADQANRAKTDFLANISHELRTPMHGILGFANLGIAKVTRIEPDKMKGYLEEIKASGHRLLNLLNDLLDLSKMEAGKIKYVFSQTRLSTLVEIVTREYSAYSAQKNIALIFHKPEFDDSALVDEEKIMQVIRNLLSNAIKFSSDNSAIVIEIQRDEKDLVVSVIDNGIGIPENELELVFDKFAQSSKTKTGAGGTGLGLAICRQIILHHKGRIWAEKNPDGGTIFRFFLPVSVANELPPSDTQ